MTRKGRATILQTFAWPTLIAAITLVSLVLGLAGRGLLDGIAVAGLVVPVAVATIKIVRTWLN